MVEGTLVRGYRQEDRVDKKSGVETFVAMKLYIDNWRWAKVPFYLRTGKRMPKRLTEIVIQFTEPPLPLFKQVGLPALQANLLVVRVQPDEGMALTFNAKIPGPDMSLGPVNMDFHYSDHFGVQVSTGYE